MSHLDVPGAKIYHEVVGKGPLLLCISGGDGSCENWRMFADNLKDHFTIVMWDRRGFSRSYLTDAQDYAHRLDRDADDAATLIKKYSPDSPATVLGNSSGGIVSLNLLIRYTDLIRTLVPYEPPASKLLPNYDEIWPMHEETYKLYQEQGPFPAYKNFGKLTKSNVMSSFRIDYSTPYLFSNMQYWFEREFMTYPNTDFDVERDFRTHKEKLMPVYGALSPKDAYQYRAMEVLCQKLELEYVELPGEHIGQLTHAKDFGNKLLEVLRARDQFYAEL